MSKINYHINKLIEKLNLSVEESEELFQIILNGGASNSQIAAVIIALKMKGEHENELTSFINNLIVKSYHSFNIDVSIISPFSNNNRNFESLLFISSLIASQAGLKVARYLNKSLSHTTDIVKFISSLGINYKKINTDFAKTSFNENNFMIISTDYIKHLYNICEVIEEINLSTILTFIPYICLPSIAKNLILIMGSKEKAELLYNTLIKLHQPIEKVWIFYNDFNVEELLKDESNYIIEIKDNIRTDSQLDLRRYKFQPLASADFLFNANYAREIIFGKRNHFYNQTLLYASLYLMITKNLNLEESILQIENIVQSGQPLSLISRLINLTNINEEILI